MPKEMLPVVDKPAIQYVVEEATAAGIEDVLIIIGRNKNNLSNHFDSVPELESNLLKKGDQQRRVLAIGEDSVWPLSTDPDEANLLMLTLYLCIFAHRA